MYSTVATVCEDSPTTILYYVRMVADNNYEIGCDWGSIPLYGTMTIYY